MRLKDTLKYRTLWIGCAMLWIVLYHAEVWVPTSILGWFKGMGYGGVDICLFASGIGCYFSLEKDSSITSFLHRRFKRLVPTYWCFLLFWFLSKGVMGQFQMNAVLGNLLGIQSFTTRGNEFNWYISALVFVYFLAPFFKELVDRTTNIFQNLIVLAVILLFSMAFWKVSKLIIIFTRVPIFYIGMIYGKKCREENELKKKELLQTVLAMILGITFYLIFQKKFESYLWKYGLYWYPFILITPGICIILSVMMEYLKRYRWVSVIEYFLNKLGNYSFEIYLMHILIFGVITYGIETLHILPNCNLTWFAAIFIVGIGCVLLRRITNQVLKTMHLRR